MTKRGESARMSQAQKDVQNETSRRHREVRLSYVYAVLGRTCLLCGSTTKIVGLWGLFKKLLKQVLPSKTGDRPWWRRHIRCPGLDT